MLPPEEGGTAVPEPLRYERWLRLAVWIASAVLGYTYLDRGWLPHDVGTLGHAAERVLHGELPHRDFVDVYTGGQAMLNALAFRLVGVQVMTMRMVCYLAYLLWIPAVWAIARRFASPQLAAAATLLAAALSLPVYPEGMPSWYNLFFATWGAAALLRFLDGRARSWLFLAGVAGGASILFKIVGLYYVAAALLFVLFVEAEERGQPSTERGAGDLAYRLSAMAACLVVAALVASVVSSGGGGIGFAQFGIPALVPVVVAALRVSRPTDAATPARFRRAAALAFPLVAGVALPIAVFLIPYASSGALADLYEGVFVLPRLRFAYATWQPLRLSGLVSAGAVVAWLAWAPARRSLAARVVAWGGGAAILAAVAFTHVDRIYLDVWHTLRSFAPVAALAGAAMLLGDAWRATGEPLRASEGRSSERARSAAFGVMAVFGLSYLVQVPYSAPIYFIYAAPLLVLFGVAMAGSPERGRSGRMLFLTAALAGFALFRVDSGFLIHLGYRYRPHAQTEALELPRARGVRVTASEKEDTEQMAGGVLGLARGQPILAMPDAPEVYFLTGLPNPTRTLYEVFDDLETRTERTLALVDSARLQVVVLNGRTVVSEPIQAPLFDSLAARFPLAAEVGRFWILWKGPPPEAPQTP